MDEQLLQEFAKKNKKELKGKLEESDIPSDDNTLKEVNSALRGAKVVASQGANPAAVSVQQLKAADPAAEPKKKEESPEEIAGQQKLMMALSAALPTLVGYAVGGYEGGAIGAKVGGDTVKSIAGGIEDSRKEKLANEENTKKQALEERKVAKEEAEAKTQDQYRKGMLDIERAKLELDRSKAGKGDPSKMFEQEHKIRQEYLGNDLTKNAQLSTEGIAKIREAAANPSAYNDVALIFNYMKVLDPRSVVREGEFATAEKAAAADDRFRQMLNKVKSGQKLTDSQRSELLEAAERQHLGTIQTHTEFSKSIEDVASRQGLNAQNILIKFGQKSPEEIRSGIDERAMARKKAGDGLPLIENANAGPRQKIEQSDRKKLMDHLAKNPNDPRKAEIMRLLEEAE